MRDISFDRFFKLRNLLQAFSFRDVQAVSVLLHWAGSNGFSPDEIVSYAVTAPHFMELERMGYFHKVTTVEQSREIKRFEMQLPKEFRREARKARLENSYSGLVNRHG